MKHFFTSFRLLAVSAFVVTLFLSQTVLAQTCADGETVDGGTIALAGSGSDSISICAGNGIADLLDVTLDGEDGDSSVWVITNDSLEILMLAAAPPFDLEGAGDGTCLIWHLSYNDSIGGAMVGARADSLTGCFDLSNSITVRRDGVNGGEIVVTATQSDSISICVDDSIAVAFDVSLSTDTVGSSGAWVITDTSLNILALPIGPPFDLEDAGAGICYIWYLAIGDSISGAAPDLNAGDLTGCFDLSNPIVVTRDTGAKCATTSVRNPLDPGQVKLYPNPVGNVLNLELSDLTSGATIIEVLDMQGRRIQQEVLQAANGQQSIPLKAVPAGTYLLRVTNDGKTLTRRFIH